jgi:hypothetical protein
MYPHHLKYLAEKGAIWFNPCVGLLGFQKELEHLMKKLDKPFNYVWRHRDLKRAKEILAISIIAKAMSKSENLTWWIFKPKVDPPDGVIGTIIKNEKGNEEMRVREVEVVECLGGDILKTIVNKLDDKQYEPNTILVCFISQGGIFDFKDISNKLLATETSLNNVFLVFYGNIIKDVPKNNNNNKLIKYLLSFSSVQVKPIYSSIVIDPINDCEDLKTGKAPAYYIYDGRGRGETRDITLESPPKLF